MTDHDIPIYNAVAVQVDAYDCKTRIGDAPDYSRNVKHICHMIDVAGKHSLEYPPKLFAVCEGAIQGFPDEIYGWDPVQYARSGAISIPGPETDAIAEMAVKWDAYVIGQAKARMPEFPDRFFNTMFVIAPSGAIVLQHRKNVVFALEQSTTPHDVYEQWVQMFGEGLDAFFPVVQTQIGGIGGCICMEGNFPETARALAINGADIIYRPSAAENKVSMGLWEVQNRARALDNNCYVVAPNTGHHYLDDSRRPGFFTGGKSMIVDYRGHVMNVNDNTGDGFAAAPINVPALRHHRASSMHLNWLPYLKSELYALIYSKAIWPKGGAAGGRAMTREAVEEVFYQTVRRLRRGGAAADGG